MNTDAMIAWMYVVECLAVFGKEVQKDYDFLRLLVDLRNAYPDEYEFVVGFTDTLRGK
jgi:hypothetical protein